ncbi:MAG: hypothetical protein ACYC3G_00800 [Minisyncoccota bacterium]
MTGRIDQQYRVRAPDYDYFDFYPANPAIPATDLIARVYEALLLRRIPFYFSYFLGDALATVGLKEQIRVHFFLPQHNVVIIVQGGYWFDSTDNLNDTALKLALIQYAGITPVFWTEADLMMKGLDALFAETPALQVPYTPGDPLHTDYPPVDYRGNVKRPPHPLTRERALSFRFSKKSPRRKPRR